MESNVYESGPWVKGLFQRNIELFREKLEESQHRERMRKAHGLQRGDIRKLRREERTGEVAVFEDLTHTDYAALEMRILERMDRGTIFAVHEIAERQKENKVGGKKITKMYVDEFVEVPSGRRNRAERRADASKLRRLRRRG